jgi:hypothetical protein
MAAPIFVSRNSLLDAFHPASLGGLVAISPVIQAAAGSPTVSADPFTQRMMAWKLSSGQFKTAKNVQPQC